MECEAGRLVRSMGSTSPRLVQKITGTSLVKGKSSAKSEGFPIMEYRPLERILEGEEHGRRKKAFHQLTTK